MEVSSRFYRLALLACLCFASNVNQVLVSAADTGTVNPVSFLHTKHNKRRSLQSAATESTFTFRSGCLYDITVYMEIRGGSTNQYDQLLFADSPTTPGGTLTMADGQTAEGASPASFELVDGGTTGSLQIEWNTQSCGSQLVDLTATVDTFEMGPHVRIVCSAGLFTVFLRMRVWLNNPQCLLPDPSFTTTPLIIDDVTEASEEEACIFQMTKYVDYTFENFVHFKLLADVLEFTTSPSSICNDDGSVCDTFELSTYPDEHDNLHYWATLTSNSTNQCVTNHQTMAPVHILGRTPSSPLEAGSFRIMTRCDGTEGYPESNLGATYFWWMTVHVLNPKTCTTLLSSSTVGNATATTAVTSKQVAVTNDKKSPTALVNVTLVDLDQLVVLAADATTNNKSSCLGSETTPPQAQQPQQQVKEQSGAVTSKSFRVVGVLLMTLSWGSFSWILA